MSDYTYIRPTDPAATEVELTEALHVQAAPLDLEYTYDAPPVRLVRASEVAELRVRLDAAEAQLAAVPDYAAYYATAWEAFEADSDGPEPLDFAEWMAQRASSQRSE